MSSQESFIDYLEDMLNAIEKARAFISGMDFKEFKQDDKTIFAVIRALEILGEASNKIPKSIQSNYDEVPWKEMTGMRNKLIHDYMGVNTAVVWRTVTEDLSVLEKMITQLKPTFRPLSNILYLFINNDVSKIHTIRAQLVQVCNLDQSRIL